MHGQRRWVTSRRPKVRQCNGKYLVDVYLTGGPISDRRLISHKNGEVTFRVPDPSAESDGRAPCCPTCETNMQWIAADERISWVIVMHSDSRPRGLFQAKRCQDAALQLRRPGGVFEF